MGETNGSAVLDPVQTAQFLTRLEGFLGAGGAFDKTLDRLAKLEEGRAVDGKKTIEELEKIRAQQEAIQKLVKRSSGPGFLPGMEDAPFSLHKAFLVSKYGVDFIKRETNGKADCSHEYEVMRAAAQSAGDDKYGGFMIPIQVLSDIVPAIYTRSVMINLVGEGQQRVRVIPNLAGAEVKIPRFYGGLLAYWPGEEDAITESVAKFGDVSLMPHKIGVLFRMTDALKLLAMPGIDALLRTDMARAIAKKLDYAVLYGTGGGGQPRGVVHTRGGGGQTGQGIHVYSAQSRGSGELGVAALGSAPFQADWNGASVTFDVLSDMRLVLEENDVDIEAGSAFIGAGRTFTQLRQLKVEAYGSQPAGDGRAFVTGPPIITDEGLASVIGPFGASNQIPRANVPGASVGAPQSAGASKFGDLFFGNWSEVLLGIWAGIGISDDGGMGVGFAKGQTYVKAQMFCDVGVRQPRGVVVCPDIQITP
jgi:HK97 family phage major capsid protein